MEELTYDQFVVYLRSALHYLYDPVHLRSSPLVALLGLSAEFDHAAALQSTLINAIGALKPATDESPQSRAWRVYDTLNFLYVRQLARDAVATQLGVSERQLRREQRMALEVLAQSFWPKLARNALHAHLQPEQGVVQPPAETDQTLSGELEWLGKVTTEQPVQLNEVLHTVQSLAQPLAQQWRVPLQVELPPNLAETSVPPLALRSILLTLLSVAIPRAGKGPVVISASQHGSEIECMVSCQDVNVPHAPFAEKNAVGLQTAQNLAAFYNAQLIFPHQVDAGYSVTLVFPAPEQIPVLVIDDNPDWIDLMQRFAAGSPYRVMGTTNPEDADSLAEKMQPAAIILDVMMRNVDGWQVLSKLRHIPATMRMPIVICTVLPVNNLALSLGANAFLQKPVTQQQFLQMLGEQCRELE